MTCVKLQFTYLQNVYKYKHDGVVRKGKNYKQSIIRKIDLAIQNVEGTRFQERALLSRSLDLQFPSSVTLITKNATEHGRMCTETVRRRR